MGFVILVFMKLYILLCVNGNIHRIRVCPGEQGANDIALPLASP